MLEFTLISAVTPLASAEKVPSPSPVIAPPIVIPPLLVFAEILPLPVVFNVPKFPVVIEPVPEDSIYEQIMMWFLAQQGI
jgi:hypothetical protein